MQDQAPRPLADDNTPEESGWVDVRQLASGLWVPEVQHLLEFIAVGTGVWTIAVWAVGAGDWFDAHYLDVIFMAGYVPLAAGLLLLGRSWWTGGNIQVIIRRGIPPQLFAPRRKRSLGRTCFERAGSPLCLVAMLALAIEPGRELVLLLGLMGLWAGVSMGATTLAHRAATETRIWWYGATECKKCSAKIPRLQESCPGCGAVDMDTLVDRELARLKHLEESD